MPLESMLHQPIQLAMMMYVVYRQNSHDLESSFQCYASFVRYHLPWQPLKSSLTQKVLERHDLHVSYFYWRTVLE